MIYDSISNISLYKSLSNVIFTGLTFLQQVRPDIENGVYQLNPRVKAIVSEYETKRVNVYGYEAHKRFIDIQYVLSGVEKVCCLPIERLNEAKPYSKETDATLYELGNQSLDMIIGNGYFAIFHPQDGHMPQLCIEEPQKVRKVVVKVEIV